MSASSRNGVSTLRPPLVGFQGIAVFAHEAGLVALFVVLPALAHALGMPGRPFAGVLVTLVPMLAVLQLILIPISAAPIHRAPAGGSK